MKAQELQGQRGVVARAHARPGANVAHPVLALQRAAGNRAVGAALVGAAPVVQRKARGTAKAQALARLKKEFGISDVREGTVAEQAKRLDAVSPDISADEAEKQLVAGGWTPWSPPEKSPDWIALVDGVARFAATVGLPSVTEILFFAQDYDVSATDRRLVPRPDVGAYYSGGSLVVFRKGTAGRFIAASRREEGAQASETRENVAYEMTHELAHGVIEKAMQTDPSLVTRYAAAMGWVGNQLYDIGRPEVQKALAARTTPPASTVVTEKNWAKAEVVEQPMAEYMVISPSEDLPEAIAAFINRPDVLKARSPRRYAFVEKHMPAWRKALGSR